ncbi:hypothetical protein D5085_02265 [Ectothiorhodospiraceae bacterium BW-2]|nr:hypothetical protein D5085_02265 [Ectothiorhodospiraceae bacterium BW-2]
MSTEPILTVSFFLTSSGNEPVRNWLKDMGRDDRKVIGEDIMLVQFRWPLGMPLVRKMEADLWEVRSNLSNGNIARTGLVHRFVTLAISIMPIQPSVIQTVLFRRPFFPVIHGV